MSSARGALLLTVCALAGCSSWSWRVAALRYSPRADLPPVHTDRSEADLAPESYAIGSTEEEGPSLEAITPRIARTGQRHGADSVLLARHEAVISSWTTVRSSGGEDRHETAREETLSVESAQVIALGIGYRSPERCVGAYLVCEPVASPIADSATCLVRVRAMVPGGPLARTGVTEGEGIIAVNGQLARSPSDVFQRADGATSLTLQIGGVFGDRAVEVHPAPCSQVYPLAPVRVRRSTDAP